MAFVEKLPGADLTEAELRKHARGLASYMRPLHYVILEPGTMPMNRTAKVDVDPLAVTGPRRSGQVARTRPVGWMRRVRIRLRGIVQGVGFRPFVHNLAGKWRLPGYVLNSSAGLVAEVEGEAGAVDRFLEAVRAEAPPLAWIQEMEVAELAA